MEYDALVAGVEPGGINNAQQVRMLVAYVLRALPDPIDGRLLSELLQYHGLANLFEVNGAIDELTEKGSVLADKEGKLTLSPQGRVAVDEWEFILPYSVREKAVRAATLALTRLKNERENEVEIREEEKGCRVVCRVLDGKQVLMEVGLWVPDRAQAEQVKERFLNDPLTCYRTTVELLTKEEQK